MNYPIQIIAGKTIRESDGLAMSSRNKLLSKEEREQVSLISKTLFESKELIDKLNVSALKRWVSDTINKNPFLNVEYFEVVDHFTLQPVSKWSDNEKITACIAVHVGRVRLIDNVNYF